MREYTSTFILPTEPSGFIEAVFKNPETKWVVAGTTLEEYNAVQDRKRQMNCKGALGTWGCDDFGAGGVMRFISSVLCV